MNGALGDEDEGISPVRPRMCDNEFWFDDEPEE